MIDSWRLRRLGLAALSLGLAIGGLRAEEFWIGAEVTGARNLRDAADLYGWEAGGGAGIELRGLFGTGLRAGLGVAYSGALPADRWVESMHSGTAGIEAGYAFGLSPRLALTPFLGGGTRFLRLTRINFWTDGTETSSGLQLMAQAGVGLELPLSDGLEFAARPLYRLTAEKEERYHAVALELGVNYRIARWERKPAVLEAPGPAAGPAEPMPDAETALDRLSGEPNIRVERTEGLIRIVVEGSFSRNEATLEDRTARQLDLIGAVIRDLEPGRILIEGYVAADAQAETDTEVSLARARASRERLLASAYLAGRDVPIETAGRGRDKPVGDNATEEGRMKNRRVDIVLENR